MVGSGSAGGRVPLARAEMRLAVCQTCRGTGVVTDAIRLCIARELCTMFACSESWHEQWFIRILTTRERGCIEVYQNMLLER